MKVISVVNRKGGVAKTATALTLGAGLKQRGYKLLYIDLDSQGNLTTNLNISNPLNTAFNIFSKGSKAVECITSENGNDLIASGSDLSIIDLVLANSIGAEYRLTESLECLRTSNSYDFVIIDTAPALNLLVANALTASDSVVIPVQADAFSYDGLTDIVQVIASIKKYSNKNLEINGILITRYSNKSIISKTLKKELTELAKDLGTRVYTNPIRECIAVKEAQLQNVDLLTYSPKCNASIDYQSFIDELLQTI